MEGKDVLQLFAVVLGSGGLLGGVYALLKLRPEAGQMTVNTAQGVLQMQSDLMKDLRAQNERLQSRVDALEAENSSLMRRLGQLERQVNGSGVV